MLGLSIATLVTGGPALRNPLGAGFSFWPRPHCAAALESSAHSNAMKPAASKTWRGRRADVWSSHPAAGMEGSLPGKTWGGRRADVGSSRAVKLMKIAAAKAAVEAAAGKTRGDGRGAIQRVTRVRQYFTRARCQLIKRKGIATSRKGGPKAAPVALFDTRPLRVSTRSWSGVWRIALIRSLLRSDQLSNAAPAAFPPLAVARVYVALAPAASIRRPVSTPAPLGGAFFLGTAIAPPSFDIARLFES